MKKKYMLFTIPILLALLLVGMQYLQNREWSSAPQADTPLVPKDFHPERLKAIHFHCNTQTVTLIRQEKQWIIQELQGQSPSNELLKGFLMVLCEIHFIQQLDLTETEKCSLRLTGDNAISCRLILENPAEELLLVFGKKVEIKENDHAFSQAIPMGRYVIANGIAGIVPNTFSMVDLSVPGWQEKPNLKP